MVTYCVTNIYDNVFTNEWAVFFTMTETSTDRMVETIHQNLSAGKGLEV